MWVPHKVGLALDWSSEGKCCEFRQCEFSGFQ